MKVDRTAQTVTILCLGVALWLLTPGTVLAHAVNTSFGDFYGGMLHPITAVPHLFSWIALGLLAGQQGPQRARWALPTLLAGLFAGLCAGWYGGVSSWLSEFNEVSLVLTGLLVVTALPVPVWLLNGLALLLGFTHGYENGADASGSAAVNLFVTGVLTSGLVLVAVPAAVVVSLRASWQQIAVRVVASWIAATGLLILSVP